MSGFTALIVVSDVSLTIFIWATILSTAQHISSVLQSVKVRSQSNLSLTLSSLIPKQGGPKGSHLG